MEAARRLGVKLPTLYAYVSRGLLSSYRDPVGRGSLFALSEIEALSARSRGGRQTATRLATVTTGITRLDPCLGPLYRGRPAIHLATTAGFEEVALGLWDTVPHASAGVAGTTGRSLISVRVRCRARPRGCGGRWWSAGPRIPGEPPPSDRRGPCRKRSSPLWRSRRSDATVVHDVWPEPRGRARRSPRASEVARPTRRARPLSRLRARRGARRPLVLLADHELATSTVAVRMAASDRADLTTPCWPASPPWRGRSTGGPASGPTTSSSRWSGSRCPWTNVVLGEREHLPGFGHACTTQWTRVLRGAARPVWCRASDRCRLRPEVAELATEHEVPPPNSPYASPR